MGSGSSRLGSRPQRANAHSTTKRTLSSLFLCGASSSSRAPVEMDDDPAEFLVNSAERRHLAVGKIQYPTTEPDSASETGSDCKPSSGTRSSCTTHAIGTGGSSKCTMVASEVSTSENGLGNAENSNEMECSSKSGELIPHQLSTHYGSEYSADTLLGDQSTSDPICANGSTSINIINDTRNTMNSDVTQNFVGISGPNSFSQHGLGDSSSDRISVGNNVNEMSAIGRSDSAPMFSDSQLPFSQIENSFQEPSSPSGLGFLVSEREQGWRDASVLHVDVIRGRIHSGIVGTGRQTVICPSGLHPEGNCSCASVLMTEESGTRGSISRIVMLAEALFEVLDEIHRQPVSLSLSMSSLPALESVVDSFPLKSHRKPRTPNEADVAQCYVCLAEYEEDDKIRILPCNHEFHMTCVDKWLKEIHGVCPLCRGDVREGLSEGCVSNS